MPVAPRVPDSADELKALTAALLAQLEERDRRIETQAAQLASQTTQIQHQTIHIDKLKFELARLKRWRFGANSEAVGSGW